MSFCIDSSSRRLSNQYLIRDHMAVHYNKILSAKGSIPANTNESLEISDNNYIK
uniref:Spermatosis associated 7 n=1 Tax=Pseudonaja textilis TaxID=8673 RepID=A0A670Y813_PSETE